MTGGAPGGAAGGTAGMVGGVGNAGGCVGTRLKGWIPEATGVKRWEMGN
jgi:hypothetical protein